MCRTEALRRGTIVIFTFFADFHDSGANARSCAFLQSKKRRFGKRQSEELCAPAPGRGRAGTGGGAVVLRGLRYRYRRDKGLGAGSGPALNP